MMGYTEIPKSSTFPKQEIKEALKRLKRITGEDFIATPHKVTHVPKEVQEAYCAAHALIASDGGIVVITKNEERLLEYVESFEDGVRWAMENRGEHVQWGNL